MNTEKRKYDATVARTAGNIASGRTWEELNTLSDEGMARICVAVARAIVAEVERTEAEPSRG